MNSKFIYKVADQIVPNKLLAIKKSNETKSPIRFHCPKEYENFDFSQEPQESLQTLIDNQAIKMRDSFKKIRLYFSGGGDSVLILKTFIRNKLPIDEIVCLKSGIKNADFEIDKFAIPILNSCNLRNTKVSISTPTINDYENYYKEGVTDKKIEQGHYSYHTFLRLHWQTEIFAKENYDSNTANIRGFDKSLIIFKNDHWYTYFIDNGLETFEHMLNFFSDDPAIQCKQAHLWKNVVEKMPSNQIKKSPFQDKELQVLWNQVTERTFDISLPLKDTFFHKDQNYLTIDHKKFYYCNFKEKYAFEYLAKEKKEIMYLWQENLKDLVDYTGQQWWNEQSPEMGTLGVLSKFYCLTKNQTKTVDELYPNGFKP